MDITRRRFLGGRIGRNPGPAPFRPPWSLPEAAFLDRCTRCDDCVKACPTGLLRRADDGFPVADFSAAECTFCGDCVPVCPPGALVRVGDAAPWSFGVGIGEGCLALQQVECRICGEVCDPRAIRFRPRPGGIAPPEVDNTSCTGCGACIAPCPVVAVTRIPLTTAPEAP